MSPKEINDVFTAARRAPVDAEMAERMSRHIVWMAQRHPDLPITDFIDDTGGAGERLLYGHLIRLRLAIKEAADPKVLAERLRHEADEQERWAKSAEAELDYRRRTYQTAIDLKMHEFEIEHRRRDVSAKEGAVERLRARAAELRAEAAEVEAKAEQVAA